jgi:hypothetical protein
MTAGPTETIIKTVNNWVITVKFISKKTVLVFSSFNTLLKIKLFFFLEKHYNFIFKYFNNFLLKKKFL